MLSSSLDAAAAAPAARGQGGESSGALGSAPVREEVRQSTKLAHAIARYVHRHLGRSRVRGAHQRGAADLDNTANEVVNGEEEKRFIAAVEEAELQLLRCLLHVRLSPNELPAQPELPGDVGDTAGSAEEERGRSKYDDDEGNARERTASDTMAVASPSALVNASPMHSGQSAAKTAGPDNLHLKHTKRMSTEGDTAAAPHHSVSASSPPPRPPPSLAIAESEHRYNVLRGTTHAASARLPSGTKAKELYYTYTHQNMPPPPQRARRTPTQSPSDTCARSTPSVVAAASAPQPDGADTHVSHGQRQRPLGGKQRQRRRRSGGEDGISERAEHPVSSPPAAASARTANTVQRRRSGSVRPLQPAEAAAALGSWPSRIVQYTVAKSVTRAAISSVVMTVAGADAFWKDAFEDAATDHTAALDGSAHANSSLPSQPAPAKAKEATQLPAAGEHRLQEGAGQATELHNLIKRLRDVLYHTHMSVPVHSAATAEESKAAPTRSAGEEVGNGAVADIVFPTFARLYLADASCALARHAGNASGDVVQGFLARLTDVLVAAAVVPESEEQDEEDTSHGSSEVGGHEGDGAVALTGDIVRDIELLLRLTPTIVAPVAPTSTTHPKRDLSSSDSGAAAASACVPFAQLYMKRALHRLLRLSPPCHDATMCTMPLVVGVLRRYEAASAGSRAQGLRIRLLPAAEAVGSPVMPSPDAPTDVSTSLLSTTNNSSFYNAMLIEVTGDDVTPTKRRGDAEDVLMDDDVLSWAEEAEAKTVFHADVPDTHRRQQTPRHRARQQQRSSNRGAFASSRAESPLQTATSSVVDDEGAADAADLPHELSRRQCLQWQQLLTLAQFVHVAGTPTQVETTARYVALAIRHRREARQQNQQQQQQTPSSPTVGPSLFPSHSPQSAAFVAPPSVAASAQPISTPAFFFTLTETSSLAVDAAMAATTRTLQFDDDDRADSAMVPASIHAAEKRQHVNSSEASRTDSGKVAVVKAPLSSPPRQGFFAWGPGLGLRALLGWHTNAPPPPLTTTTTTVTSAPQAGAPPPLSPTATAAAAAARATPTRRGRLASPTPAAAADAATSFTEDAMLRWMHDTLIPVFYETTVSCSEATEMESAAVAAEMAIPASGANAAAAAASTEGKADSSIHGTGRRHRYRLRRQRALLGRVQAITAPMVHNFSSSSSGGVNTNGAASSEASAETTARVIHVDGEDTPISEANLLSYLLLHQLFFDSTAPPVCDAAGEAEAPDSASVVPSAAAARRAHSAPLPSSPATETAGAGEPARFEAQYPLRSVSSTSHSPPPPLQQHFRHHRAQSAAPHRMKRLPQQHEQRRVSFREDAAGTPPRQLVATKEKETKDTHSTAGGNDAVARRAPSSPSPSPKSILKSGRRYKAEKLVRSSAPAASVVPFRSFLLWRCLVAEVLPTSSEDKIALRVEDLSPMLSLSSAAYVLEAQGLAVRVASDVATALLLAGLQAEQYACYRQLQRNQPAQTHKKEAAEEMSDPIVQRESTATPPAVSSDAEVEGDGSFGHSAAGVVAARRETTFQCDSILPLAKGVAEAVVRAALAPVVFVAGVPEQLQCVIPGSDRVDSDDAGEESSDGDATDGVVRAREKRKRQRSRETATTAARGANSPNNSGPSISVLSPALPPDVYQRFQVLSILCICRVQREVLESLTKPLHVGLRRLTWSLAWHRQRLLCQPLVDFWAANSDVIALTEAALSSSGLSKSTLSGSELLQKWMAAERGLCRLARHVFELYENSLLLPHLLSSAGAPHTVELSLGGEDQSDGGDVGEDVGGIRTQTARTTTAKDGAGGLLQEPLVQDSLPLTPMCEDRGESSPLTWTSHPQRAPQPQAEGEAISKANVYPSQHLQPPPSSPWWQQPPPSQQPGSTGNAFVPLGFSDWYANHKASMNTFTTIAEASLSQQPQHPMHQQQQTPVQFHQRQLSPIPHWAGLGALSAWSSGRVDIDTTFDLHSSLCCEWRSMRLSGGAGSLDGAANDFAMAVAAASPLRLHAPSALQITQRQTPRCASSSSRGMHTSTVVSPTNGTASMTTTTTAATLSAVDAVMSSGHSVVPTALQAGEKDNGGGAAKGTAFLQYAAQSHSMSVASPLTLLSPVTAACAPHPRVADRLDSADELHSPMTVFEGSPARQRFASRGLRLLPPHEPQPQASSTGVLSPSSFLAFAATTRTPQRLHMRVFGAAAPVEGEKRKERSTASADSWPLRTQPPTAAVSLNRQEQSLFEATKGKDAEDEKRAPRAGSPHVDGDDATKPTSSSSSSSCSSPFFAAQLRRGDIVESRLLSPFVEESKRAVIGSFMQHWLLPRWELLTHVGRTIAKLVEYETKGKQQVYGTTVQVHTEPTSTTPSSQREEEKDDAHDFVNGDGVRGSEKLAKTAKPSINTVTHTDTTADHPLAPSAPLASLTPLTPVLYSASGATGDRGECDNDSVGAVHKHEEEREEGRIPSARLEQLQHALSDIMQACRGLSRASQQYELALALKDRGGTSLHRRQPRTNNDNKRNSSGTLDMKESPEATVKPGEVGAEDVHPSAKDVQLATGAPTCASTPPVSTANISSTSLPFSTSSPSSPPPPPLPSSSSSPSQEFVAKSRQERERILALCHRMSNLLEGNINMDSEEEGEGKLQVPLSSHAHPSGQKDDMIGAHHAPSEPLTDRIDDPQPLDSLSQGMCGPPCSTPSDASLVVLASGQQPCDDHRRSSAPSAGPSQLFAPLHGTMRRYSTGYTLTSVPAALMAQPSNTLVSMPFSEAEDGSSFDNSALTTVPSMSVATPLSIENHLSSLSVGLPRLLAPTVLRQAAVVIVTSIDGTLPSSAGIESKCTGSAVTAPPQRSSVDGPEAEEKRESGKEEDDDVGVPAAPSLSAEAEDPAALSEAAGPATATPLRAPERTASTTASLVVVREDAAQQTPARVSALKDAETQTSFLASVTALPAEDAADTLSSGREESERCSPSVVSDRETSSSTPRSANSQRSVETAEVTPYKQHPSHHSRRCPRSGTHHTRSDGEAEGIHNDADVDEEGSEYTTSTLSPVSEHSSNRLTNAIASGRSSPMPSSPSFSSMAAATFLPIDAPSLSAVEDKQDHSTTCSNHRKNETSTKVGEAEGRETNGGGQGGGRDELRPASPVLSSPQVARCISLDSRTGEHREQYDAVRVHRSNHSGNVDVSKTHNKSASTEDTAAAASAMRTTAHQAVTSTTVIATATPPSPSSPWRERTPTRNSEAAVSALADLQQRLGGSNSTVLELRQQLDRAQEDARGKDVTMAQLQRRLKETEAELRRAVASQEAQLERLQLHPPPPLAPSRCSVAVNTVADVREEVQQQAQQQTTMKPLLSPSVPSTPSKEGSDAAEAERDALPFAEKKEAVVVERADLGVQTCMDVLPPKPEIAAVTASKVTEASSSESSTTSSATTPHDTTLVLSQISAEKRVHELEADLRNAAFRIEQWKALLEAERHARAVQVDQLSQQLGSEQRRLQRQRSSLSRSRSRSLSPFVSDQATNAGVVVEVLTPDAEASATPQNVSDVNEDPLALCVGETTESSGAAAEAEEQRLTAALAQQADELKEREDALKGRIAHVLDRLHAAETRLEEQRQQMRREAAEVATARESERAVLQQRVMELEGEVNVLQQGRLANMSVAPEDCKRELNIEEGSDVSKTKGATEEGLEPAPSSSDDAAVFTAVAARHEEAIDQLTAHQQRLEEELREEQQKRADEKALHDGQVAALRHAVDDAHRDAHAANAALQREEEAHDRSRMALGVVQAAVTAAQISHKVETALFRRDTTAWWAATETITLAWTEEKSLMVQETIADHLHSQERRLRLALDSAREAATQQEAELTALRATLTAERAEAEKREDALKGEVSAHVRDAATLAAEHSANAAVQCFYAAQAAQLRESTMTWWMARERCAAEWADAAMLCLVDAAQCQLRACEARHKAIVVGLHSTATAHEATIRTLYEQLSHLHAELDAEKTKLQSREEAHSRAVGDLERVNAALAVTHEAQQAQMEAFRQFTESLWTAYTSCLSDWTEAKSQLLADSYGAVLSVSTQTQRESVAKATAAAASAHEAALRDFDRQLTNAQHDAQESRGKLQKEEAAHTRTIAAFNATQAATAVVLRGEGAQHAHLHRLCATWWEAREACMADWMEAKSQLLHTAYAAQQQQSYQTAFFVALERLTQSVERQSAHETPDDRAATPVKPTDVVRSPQAGDRVDKTKRQGPERRSRASQNTAEDVISPRRSKSPDVVMMSLEDPLGLRYELQRKSRRIRRLEEQVRQLEATHVADRQALDTLQSLRQHDRQSTAMPHSTAATAVAALSPTPSRAPSQAFEGMADEVSYATPSSSPNSTKSRRLTPNEYRQRFAGM